MGPHSGLYLLLPCCPPPPWSVFTFGVPSGGYMVYSWCWDSPWQSPQSRQHPPCHFPKPQCGRLAGQVEQGSASHLLPAGVSPAQDANCSCFDPARTPHQLGQIAALWLDRPTASLPPSPVMTLLIKGPADSGVKPRAQADTPPQCRRGMPSSMQPRPPGATPGCSVFKRSQS